MSLIDVATLVLLIGLIICFVLAIVVGVIIALPHIIDAIWDAKDKIDVMKWEKENWENESK